MEKTKLSTELLSRVKLARETREANFPSRIFFATPNSTTVISMTGSHCDLNCAHCGGKYLKGMTQVEDVGVEIARKKSTSCLISGGCTSGGYITHNLGLLKPVIAGLKINTHVGLISESEMQALAGTVDCVSFDFIVDDATIREVYNLPEKCGKDYKTTFQMLKRYAKVMPHICIGLKGGEMAGEYQALDVLHQLGTEGLVFIIFIPTKGTLFADHQPPKLEEVVELFAYARQKFPSIPIHLGCMRPGGYYRAQVDFYAVETGLNKIVNPTPLAVQRAKELGYEIIYEKDCCVL